MQWVTALFFYFCFLGNLEASLLKEEAFYDVHPLTVGPRVGMVTESSVQLHGRGTSALSGVTYLVARIAPYSSSSYVNQDFLYYRQCLCRPEHDYCSMMTFEGLTKGQKYFYEMGYIESPKKRLVATSSLRWKKASSGTFETDDDQSKTPLSFVVGSCRNYIRFLGWNFGLKSGDQTFGSILKQVEKGDSLDLFLMIGDQVYSDLYWLVDWFYRAKTLDAFNKLHRTAFSTPKIKQLMATTSTLMQEDDHLYRDNYTTEVAGTEPDVFVAALKSFRNYQFYLGPEAPLSLKYWYTASRKGARFFFFDTRFERTRHQIISEGQLKGFSNWLEGTKSHDLLFLVSPVPMICQENPDGWYGYPQQLATVTNLLIQKGKNPVILSGDAHAAYSGQYEIFKSSKESKSLLATDGIFTEVVSSGFYAYTYDVSESFKGKVCLPEQGLMFFACSKSPVRTQNLFTRITVNRKTSQLKLFVQVYAANGDLLDDLTYPLS